MDNMISASASEMIHLSLNNRFVWKQVTLRGEDLDTICKFNALACTFNEHYFNAYWNRLW